MEDLELIAEIGVNHNGDIDLAKKLVDEAKSAGFDTVKVQMYETDELVTEDAPLAGYQSKTGYKSQHEMLLDLSLGRSEIKELHEHARDAGIGFLATPFGITSLDFLVDDLGASRVKIGSGDITYAKLLFEAGKKDVDLILSTGMSTMDEIRNALSVFLLGRKKVTEEEMSFALIEASNPAELLLDGHANIALLHCTSCYPTPTGDVNIAALSSIKTEFSFCRVGYSDHTQSATAMIMAIALGASVIEKHITLNAESSGPDHAASLEVGHAKEFVNLAREAVQSIGSPIKGPAQCENDVIGEARRSLHVSEKISAGIPVGLTALRPAGGINPMLHWDHDVANASHGFREGERFVE